MGLRGKKYYPSCKQNNYQKWVHTTLHVPCLWLKERIKSKALKMGESKVVDMIGRSLSFVYKYLKETYTFLEFRLIQ